MTEEGDGFQVPAAIQRAARPFAQQASAPPTRKGISSGGVKTGNVRGFAPVRVKLLPLEDQLSNLLSDQGVPSIFSE